MANKIKALIKGSENQSEFKDLLGKEIENVPGSENVKKQYKRELFKEISSDEDYQNLSREKKEKKGTAEKSEEKKETKETDLSDLQNKILSKPNMTAHHKAWLQKRTDELIKNNDKAGLEQLDKNINFTEKGGLIINTTTGPIKFAPKQASFNDVKDIEGIKENNNIWTENKETKKKGLWANFEASEKMKKSGKKICSDEQYLAAANAFPGGNTLDKNNWSTKAKDFFDLLGVDQVGFRLPGGNWGNNDRILWSSSVSGDISFYMGCYADLGALSRRNERYGFGVWFLED